MVSRLLIVIPLALSIVSFVLTTLALFAGHKEGFMEDYAIVRLNTSMVGHNLFDSDDSSKDNDDDDDDDDDDGFFGDIQDIYDDAKDDVKDELDDIAGDLTDKVANAIGISEWYSVHVMDACQGNFAPNPTAVGSSLNSTNCTSSAPASRFNLTKILDHELDVGPFDLNLAKIDWPDAIQDALDVLNDALLGLFVVYAMGVGFSGLAILGSAGALFAPARHRVALGNLVVATLGAVTITVGSIIVAVAAGKGADKINDVGDDVGVSAEQGRKFSIITWVAAGTMIAAALLWVGQFCFMKRQRKVPRSKETY